MTTPPAIRSPAPESILSLHDVSKFFGGLVALERVSLSFAPGEFVVVLGANGTGKTTLLRLLALLQTPSVGEVRFRGQRAARPAALSGEIGFAGHDTFLYDELTVEENLRFYAQVYGVNGAARIPEVLAEMGLAGRAATLVRQLSRGLRQRASLARASLHRPAVLLLDEPATGLDAEARRRLDRWLRACHAQGCTIIASSHEPREALAAATRLVLLEKGRVALDVANSPERAREVEARLLETEQVVV